MQVLQTTLLTGPYDWDAAVLPRAEFAERLSRVRHAMAASGARGLLLHGYAGDQGALAYLTNFTPKLDIAVALVPMTGDIRLFVSGTDLMIPQARLVTWVEDVRPLQNLPKLVGEWLGEREATPLASWGTGTMAQRIYAGITASTPLIDLDGELDAVRRRKTPRELDLMRGSCRLLGVMAESFAASVRSGAGVRTAALAAERKAVAEGAQDARTMASLRAGGVALPLDGNDDPVLDPVNAAFAVRSFGYWAVGRVTIAKAPAPGLARAEAALAAAVKAARPGVAPSVECHPIGLSLEEGATGVFEAGATYALSASVDGAVASAMIAVTDTGAETLWSSAKGRV